MPHTLFFDEEFGGYVGELRGLCRRLSAAVTEWPPAGMMGSRF